MQGKVFVVGVGMTKYTKPGTTGAEYTDLGAEATAKALGDAGLEYSDLQQAAVGYVLGDTGCGQNALLSNFPLTGLPIYNTSNACASGSTALALARQFVEGGISDCVLALGFEKMAGSPAMAYKDRADPMARAWGGVEGFHDPGPMAPKPFAAAAKQHAEMWGTTPEQFAMVGQKNHSHASKNPNAWIGKEFTLQQVLDSPMAAPPLTLLQCSAPVDGGAAAILASERFVDEHGLQAQAIEIIGQTLMSDTEAPNNDDPISLIGTDMTRQAARALYESTGLGPDDIDVIELHDCFSPNELISYEALGLCEPGKSGELIQSGAVTYGGKWVVNPSGGLIGKGHPLGATGVGQCAELTWQLRGEAGDRQVEGAKVGLQHNMGGGGIVITTMYRATAA